MDAMQHVNNASYFRYFETVRIEWVHSVGATPNPPGPVIVNAFCNFFKQIEFPGTIVAKHYVAKPGRTGFDTFDTFMTLERDDDLVVVYANGGAAPVWVDFKAQKSAPLPAWFRDLLLV